MPNSAVNDKGFAQSPHVDDLNSNFHQSSSTKPKSNMTAVDDSESSAADNMKSLVQECGLSPHKISELLQELPPQRLSDVLIDYYFTSMYVCSIVCGITHNESIEIGPVIPSLKKTFAPPTYPSAAM